MSDLPKHKEQFNRVLRWYDRIQKIAEGREHNVSSENYIDDYYAFFLNCYHLKDWIKEDQILNQNVKNKVEEYIKDNRCLRICADLCNGLKHLRLNSKKFPPRSNEEPEFGGKAIILNLGKEAPVIQIRPFIKTNTETIDVFKLATECVQKWSSFFTKYNLD